MSSLAQSSAVVGRPDPTSASSPFITVRLLQAAARFIDSYGWLCFAIVSAICGWIRLASFSSRPLDHDELYTFYIAQAPTLQQLVALTRTVDLHPPLSYLLIRASFAIFGVSTWACRLPSVLAFLGATALIFAFMKHALSPVYGLASVLILWSVPFTYQADEARPYSLLLFFTALLLLGWYQAIEPDVSGVGPADFLKSRRFALMTVVVSGFGLLLSHVLGALPYAAFFGAELVCLAIRRKSDWALWIALLVPSICLLTYIPLLHTHSGILFTDEYHATPMRIVNCYRESVRFLVVPLAFTALFLLFWPPLGRGSQLNSQDDSRGRPAQCASSVPRIWALNFLLFCLAMVPTAVGIAFAHTGTAFFDRYGVVFIIPLAVVPALALGLRTHRNWGAGLALVFVLSFAFFLNTTGKLWLIEQLGSLAPPKVARLTLNTLTLPRLVIDRVKPRVSAHLQKALDAALPVTDIGSIAPELPLVANTGLTFLEMDRTGSAALVQRLYLLDDRQAAASIAHDTVFENYSRLKEVFPIRGKIEPYCAFVQEHPRFLVLGAYNHPQGWLLKKLDMEGADLQILGTYAGITEEAQLYEVSGAKPDCTTQP